MSSAAEQAIDHATRVLRASGGRMTSTRRVVLGALADGVDHVTAEELVSRVRATDPRVNRSSVYRTLDALVRSEVVRHVHVQHGGTAYHLVRPESAPHLHAQCEACGDVVDLPADLLDAARAEVLRTHGFDLDPGHVAMSGTCRACAEDANV